jgi:hypothetical protein
MFGVLKSQFSPRGVVEGEGLEGGKEMQMTSGSKGKVAFSSFFELQNS